MSPSQAAIDERVVVLLRDPRAERITSELVEAIGVTSCMCTDMASLAGAVIEGAAAVLIMEEVLLDRESLGLRAILERQPPWSDLPVLVVSASGGESTVAQWAERGLRNVTLLERPMRIRVLVSALRSALSARRRQYELREQVEALHASNTALQRRTAGLRLLADAAALVLASNDPDAMLNALFDRIASHAGVDVSASFIAEPVSRTLRLTAAHGFSAAEQRALEIVDYGDAVCGKAAERGLPVVVGDVQVSDEPMVRWLRSAGVNAYMSFPLAAQGRLLGTLAFGTRRRPRFATEEIEFLATLAHYATLAHERARLIGELRESDRRKDEFLATLAHELRNPLAPMRNGLEVMKLAGPAPPAAEYARVVLERQLMQMVRIVDDLLDVSRVTAGKLTLKREDVAIMNVIATAVDTARPAIEAGGHELSIDVTPEPLAVHADPLRLAQAFTNLLNNAAKYADRAGRIAVGVRAVDAFVEVSVTDQGLGIAPEALTKIFEPFAQGDHTLDQMRGGLGIGLTLAKRVVELHGGHIEAHSAGRGQGSTFVVRIPLASTGHVSVAAGDAAESMSARPLRVLVADDNRDAAQTLGTMLRLQGHDVRVVHDGEAAVQQVTQFRPEVAILDIGMPELNGYDAAARIRADPDAAGVVLAALTGWGQYSDRQRAKAAGFDHHFTKPLDFPALERVLAGITPRAHSGPRPVASAAARH